MTGIGPDPVYVCAFRGIPRWRRNGPPPEEDPRPEPEAYHPLTYALIYMVGGMGCFVFLFLIALYVLAHSPLVAN